MTVKNKIRAEIERLINAEWKWQNSIEGKYRCETYRELLQFINSLPEESVSNDLEEAAIEYCGGSKGADARVRAGFIMSALWQKEQMINKACEWLLNNIRYYSTNALGAEYMCDDFRKAMEAQP